MIEINLLPGKKKKKTGAGISLPDFSDIAERIKDPLLIVVFVLFLIAVPVVGWIFVTESAELARLNNERDQWFQQSRRFQNLIREKQVQERLRDSLVVELDAIREIDADRYVWAHVLEEVTKALPDFTWLMGVEFVPAPQQDLTGDAVVDVKPPVRFTIAGRTADIGAYTRFLRNLGTSPWLAQVEPGRTETVTEGERPLIAFTITGTFQQADSAFIRTVPLQQSVR